jgi:hypothetical protein
MAAATIETVQKLKLQLLPHPAYSTNLIPSHYYTMWGYEVSGMILLQAYLYTYMLLRGVTFNVLPLSSYTFGPMLLPLPEAILELHCGRAYSAIVTFLLSIS